MPSVVIESYIKEFARYRSLAEKAAAQTTWEELRTPLDPESNSVAVIMKHLGGNLRSRWTNPFTTDGEKPWRNRDSEFVDDFADRAAMEAHWRTGWDVLEGALGAMTDDDLPRRLFIRGEAHTLALALARSLSHAAYHGGQIVQLCRVHSSRAGRGWSTLTVPRGGSAAFNAGMGYEPRG